MVGMGLVAILFAEVETQLRQGHGSCQLDVLFCNLTFSADLSLIM